jgi:hypothetical protein
VPLEQGHAQLALQVPHLARQRRLRHAKLRPRGSGSRCRRRRQSSGGGATPSCAPSWPIRGGYPTPNEGVLDTTPTAPLDSRPC